MKEADHRHQADGDGVQQGRAPLPWMMVSLTHLEHALLRKQSITEWTEMRMMKTTTPMAQNEQTIQGIWQAPRQGRHVPKLERTLNGALARIRKQLQLIP